MVSAWILVAALSLGADIVPDGVSMGTRLMEITPDGRSLPLAGGEGWVVATVTRPTPHGQQESTVGRWRAVSGDDGRILFNGVKPLDDARYQIIVPFQGVTYRSQPFQLTSPPPTEMQVFHATPRPEDLKLLTHYTVDVGEAFLRVTQLVRVQNDGHRTVDYTHAPIGLRMPTLNFVVMDRVPTWGIFPSGRVHGDPRPSTGQGQLVGENGALVFRGPVPPGGALFFQFRYNIPYNDEEIDLGAVSDLPLAEAAVTLQSTNLAYPRLRLHHDHRAVAAQRDNVVRYDLLLNGPVAAGEAIRMTVDRLPIQTKVPVWIASAGMSLGGMVFLALLLGAWRRRT